MATTVCVPADPAPPAAGSRGTPLPGVGSQSHTPGGLPVSGPPDPLGL